MSADNPSVRGHVAPSPEWRRAWRDVVRTRLRRGMAAAAMYGDDGFWRALHERHAKLVRATTRPDPDPAQLVLL